MSRSFPDYIRRKQSEYGDKFDPSELAEKFRRFYESGQRVIVKTRYGEIKRGYIGVTTGWKPVFLLMANSRSVGSSDTLTAEDSIIGTVNKYK